MKKENENNWVVANALVVAVVAVFVISCNAEQSDVFSIEETAAGPKSLTYPFDAHYSGIDDKASSIGVQKLWSCIDWYCSEMHTLVRYSENGQSDAPEPYYSQYRKELCKADFFMEYVNAVEAVEISESPQSIPESDRSTFAFSVDVRCEAPPNGDFNATSISFSPLETIDQRVEVRELAFRSYYAAIQKDRVSGPST